MLGNPDPEGLARLRTRFQLGEPAAVEDVFFSGKLGNRPSLKHGTAIDGTEAQLPYAPTLLGDPAEPLAVVRAIGLLEHWIAAVTGSTGVIHAPRYAAETFGSVSNSLLTSQGPQVRTKLGTVTAFGTGYPGTAPVNATAEPAKGGKTWLYATAPVQIRRSTVLEPEPWGDGNVDLSSNAGFRLLERAYVIDIPCHRVAAVRTDLPLLTPQPAKEEGAA